MNATQKKALRKKLSTLAKERWARKRKKEKGKKEGTWKAERTETNGIVFHYHKQETPKTKDFVNGKEEAAHELSALPIRWFTIEDVQEVKALSNRLGNETFLKLVGMFG